MLPEPDEKNDKDFDANVLYSGQIITEKGYLMQSIHIAKTGSQPTRLRVAAFTGKIECKNNFKVVRNSMSRDQQMWVKKLSEQQASSLPFRGLVEML